jgi:hypothetical protein
VEFVSGSTCKEVTPGEGRLAECISLVMAESETDDPADAQDAGGGCTQGWAHRDCQPYSYSQAPCRANRRQAAQAKNRMAGLQVATRLSKHSKEKACS